MLVANELLDALPVHQVVMREDGLREVYVEARRDQDGGLVTSEGPPSTPALAGYLERLGDITRAGLAGRDQPPRRRVGAATPRAACGADSSS